MGMIHRSILLLSLIFVFSFVIADPTETIIRDDQNSTFSSGIDLTGSDIWADNFRGTIFWNLLSGAPSGFSDNIDNDTTYTNGSGISLISTQFNHSDTSSVSNSDNSGNTFIQDLTFDGFGHVLSVVTASVDFSNYFTAAQILGFNYFNSTNFPYNNLVNFTNGPGYVTNSTVNKTVDCSNIVGDDPDFCNDANSSGGSGNTTEEIQDVVGASFNITLLYDDVNNISGVNLTHLNTLYATSEITDTNASTACSGTTTYLDGEGNCDDISSVYHTLDNGSFNDNITAYGNYFCNATSCYQLSSFLALGSGGGNTTEQMVDAVLSQANSTINYNDAGDKWGINQSWLTIFINTFGFFDEESDLTVLLDDNYEVQLNNEAGLYAVLSDVTLFLEDLVDDSTPQLGGYLDTNNFDIGSTSDEIQSIYIADDEYIYFGNDQDIHQGWNTTGGYFIIA